MKTPNETPQMEVLPNDGGSPVLGMDVLYNQPFVGGYFSPNKDGYAMVAQLIKEDECFYYFDDHGKYPKDLPWMWFRVQKPADKIETNEPFVFPYDTYSLWSRQLAKLYTVRELQEVVEECEKDGVKYARQHLAAIEATSSMQSQSQRRAHARNNVAGNYERRRAYSDAIELHKYYPDRCKQSQRLLPQIHKTHLT